MPLDESINPDVAIEWPSLDGTLLYTSRPQLPAFPVHLLPPKWRAWAESASGGFVPVDYLAQVALAVCSAAAGGGVVARVTNEWTEPLLLWQAMIGGPSSGKSFALQLRESFLPWIKGREGMEGMENESGVASFCAGALTTLTSAQAYSPRGVSLWREELDRWMALMPAGERPAWIAGWSAHSTATWREITAFALGIVGALRPEGLPEALAASEDIAARFLFTWPERPTDGSLVHAPADFTVAREMMERIAGKTRTAEHPGNFPFGPEAVQKIEALLPGLRRRMDEADGLEAAWIGKAPATIVRLAALLSLMHWSEEGREEEAQFVEAGFVDAAHALWANYFHPHAQAVFGFAGTTQTERLARRAARWLKRARLDQVSLKDIRREALAEILDADSTEDVVSRLEAGGVLKAQPVPESGPQGGRPRRRWWVNPALR
jgi:hypothetical protein